MELFFDQPYYAPGNLVTGTVIFRLLETINGLEGVYMNINGKLRNSFKVSEGFEPLGELLSEGGTKAATLYKHTKELL